jgi:hypothetical protein
MRRPKESSCVTILIAATLALFISGNAHNERENVASALERGAFELFMPDSDFVYSL